MVAVIEADWPAPAGVRAFSTTRLGGISRGNRESLNLGLNSGDATVNVLENRRRLGQLLPAKPKWLQQVHGTECIEHDGNPDSRPEADAIFTREAGQVCAVLTADCVPVLLTDVNGAGVAAAHAGWRGLAAGVLRATVQKMGARPEDLMAWIGPCISGGHYEVGSDVRDAFISRDANAADAFLPSANRWLADLVLLARKQLHQLGVDQVYGGQFCTYSDQERFFSYRRDRITGRMASLIWLS